MRFKGETLHAPAPLLRGPGVGDAVLAIHELNVARLWERDRADLYFSGRVDDYVTFIRRANPNHSSAVRPLFIADMIMGIEHGKSANGTVTVKVLKSRYPDQDHRVMNFKYLITDLLKSSNLTVE